MAAFLSDQTDALRQGQKALEIDLVAKRPAPMRLASKLATYGRLGLGNVARVGAYRLRLRLGIHPVLRLRAAQPEGDFFSSPATVVRDRICNPDWKNNGILFGHRRFPIENETPNWHCNVLTGQSFPNPLRPWWRLPDFDSKIGDIKGVWELSRMDWVLALAQHAAMGDASQLARLNQWLSDWCQSNPPYLGPNWKCGQEASIRVLHLLIAAHMLGQLDTPCRALIDLVAVHLQRIYPTLSYAVGQSNNHATSEAAALFVGGDWLSSHGHFAGDRWNQVGRRWLENRALRLIACDGTFSQYSVNYHRLMLDTYSVAVWWQRSRQLPAFTDLLHRRLVAATEWLHVLIDSQTGDAANLGTNDGANLLPLTAAGYRDFRPTVCLAKRLFQNECVYADDPNSQSHLSWFGVTPAPSATATTVSRVADDGGVAVLCAAEWKVVFRYPRFQFRPGQADAMHVDLWVGHENILRDAGSYCYNTEQDLQNYFSGTAGHNTIQFDSRDQMPWISRFLFGKWLHTRQYEPWQQSGDLQRIAAGYCDYRGASHHRRVVLQSHGVTVTDRADGFKHHAVLRWRLIPGEYQLTIDQQTVVVTGGTHRLTVKSSAPIVHAELASGWESRFYTAKTRLPVLEVQISQPSTFVTTYELVQ